MNKVINKEEVTFKEYEVSTYIESKEDIIMYLNGCLEENDSKLLLLAIRDIAKTKGITKLAKNIDITREGLSKALSQKGNPKLNTFLQIMNALNLKFKFGNNEQS